jgi:hypothetical protein
MVFQAIEPDGNELDIERGAVCAARQSPRVSGCALSSYVAANFHACIGGGDVHESLAERSAGFHTAGC